MNDSSGVILIVDDDKISRRLLSYMLKNMGFRTLGVEDGYYLSFSCEYFSHIRAILMDMNMPKLNGYKTTRKIKNLYKKKIIAYIPIIAVTIEEDKTKCLKAGCDGYLLKPVTRDMLAASLSAVGVEPVHLYAAHENRLH